MLTAAKKEFIEFMMSADVLRFGEFYNQIRSKDPVFRQHRQLQDRPAELPPG